MSRGGAASIATTVSGADGLVDGIGIVGHTVTNNAKVLDVAEDLVRGVRVAPDGALAGDVGQPVARRRRCFGLML